MYDTIVVGSGNGACGFLSCYLEANPKAEKILVIEEGQDFFSTSDITHQKSWSQSYTTEKIYKLHQAFTPEGTPIITGRACTMGGGGSLNYTMIHESSEWLAKQMGRTTAYWDELKDKLNQKFERSDPTKNQSSVTKHVLEKARTANFQLSSSPSIHNIVNHQEGNADLLHLFTTQFNQFGQRTNSGVSIVNWNDPRLELKTHSKVVELKFAGENKARCVGVKVKNLVTGETQLFSLADKGRLILCAGAATPRLLMAHRERLHNDAIGQQASDHIAIPLGLYILDRQIDATQRDNYLPVFATTVWHPGTPEETTCTFDFFAGDLPELLYFFPQLYFPFLVPNWLETIIIKLPTLFYLVKNLIRELIRLLNLIINLWWSVSNLLKGKSWRHPDLPLITAVLKFSPARKGYYSDNSPQVKLRFFAEDEAHFSQDKEVAKYVLKQHLEMINSLGQQPPRIVRYLLRLTTKIPYRVEDIDRYIDATSKYFLSTEQHLSGGCLFGKAIASGLENTKNTGKVYGSANVHVADLSAVPLPRVSTQMTAYLVGFHVAKMLCSNNSQT